MTNTSFAGHVITSFTHENQADYYYNELMKLGYTNEDVTVFVSEAQKDAFKNSNLDDSTTVAEGVGEGSMVGGTAGAIIGLIVGVGGNAIIPGLGLVVAGPLLGALVGAGAGGVTGGIIGALTALGVSEDYAETFEKEIEDGHIIVAVDPKPGQKEKIKEMAERFHANNTYCE